MLILYFTHQGHRNLQKKNHFYNFIGISHSYVCPLVHVSKIEYTFKWKISQTSKPVSYTHLDVYKRQDDIVLIQENENDLQRAMFQLQEESTHWQLQ